MSYCRKIILSLCSGLLLCGNLAAQFRFERAVVINKEQGMPNNDIYSIRKGADGFIWVGTNGGLCRFDGQQVKVFREGPDLRHSLLDNSVFSVLPVNDQVWAGTNQGISVLNTRDNTFRHYQFSGYKKADSLARKFDQSISVLFRDRRGLIWIGTRDRGVCLYEEKKDHFRFFPLSQEKFPPLIPSLGLPHSVLSIEDSRTNDSIIWAGTLGGLQEINRFTGEVKLYTFPQKSKDYQVALNAFRRMYHHDDGLVYVGSWAASVNVFDPETKTLTPLEVKNADGKKILNNPIGDIIRKSDHEIWITTAAGLAVYDTKLKDVTWLKFNNPAENEYYALDLIDEANRVWQGDAKGLLYFDPAMEQFSSYSLKQYTGGEWGFIFYILHDKTGNKITVCPRFTDRIYHFDKIKKEWTPSPFPSSTSFRKELQAVRGFVELSPGEYIISSDKGIFLFSENRKKMTPIRQGPPFSPTKRGDLLLDRSGNLWISDDVLGLVKWKPGSPGYTTCNKGLRADPTDTTFSRLINLFEDKRGNIWFQRINGLGVFIRAKDTILNFIYTKNEANSFPNANSFAEDKKGRIWVSGGDGWLGYIEGDNPEKGVVYKINIKDRGLSGLIPFLATDPNGEVWGYTSRELVKINSGDLSFTTYSFLYGIPEPDFYHFSFLPSGEIIFGGRNDIVITDPSKLKRNTEVPEPYIDELEVMNQPFGVTVGSPLRLRHNQNFFSIGFSAKAFTLAREVRFRYRLRGFDDWTEVKGRRFANYTNVPGGDYVFQLQAANNEGAWNKNILEFPIHIETPFWMTWWFRVGVALAVLCTGYWLYRYRVGQIKKKQKMKSEYEKKLANSEMSALLAQMNPHFLFNSLNSIDSYIIRNESKQASEYLNNFARLMRLILQNSRSNYISLKDELEALELYLQMESLRFKNKFRYAITVDENIDTNSIVIPPMLIQPYVENAIWHGLMHKTNGEEGKVELRLSRNENNLLCVIRDNGIGRKKAGEWKAQKQSSHKRSMGMQITEDRIEIINKLFNINASVRVDDLVDARGQAEGTKVELTIPV